MNEKQIFTNILEEEIIDSKDISEEEKRKFLKKLFSLKDRKTNIMITGATGCGKSSTINALFKIEKAKVGVGVDPETMDITKYELDNLILWDSPGLGDGEKEDKEHYKKIIKKLNEYRLNHLEFDVGNRGEWRKFNPNNPYVAEEENKAKDLKVDSLDDLFADDANQDNNKNKEEIKTETKTANTQNIADAPMLPDDEEFAYDIQKELEAKFDELFGTENVANKTN